MPDPTQAADLGDYLRLLDQLRMQCGEPSLRTLARMVGPLLRPPRVVAHSTLATLFQPGRRRLDQDLLSGIVRALTADESTVSRWREEYLRVHREAKTGGPEGVLRQLPPDLATFTGRGTVLEQLLATATRPAGAGRATTVVVTAIEGMAGVGKTQLAVHAAHELVRSGLFTDAQLYVNLRGFDTEQPPTEPAAVLDGFLRALGIPAQHIPPTLDERAAMFRDRMQDRRALILLDNAGDDAQVRDLIPNTPSCLVLITSRRSLAGIDGAQLVGLEVFDREESLALLTSVVGDERVAAELDAAEDLLAATGGLPLAVALVASRLRARPAWSLAEAARALRGRGLDGIQHGGRSLRALIDLSFQGLSEPAKAVMHAIGVHPGSDYTVPAMAAACGLEPAQAEAAMEELVFESLAQERVSERFEVHDLIRAYCVAAVADGSGGTGGSREPDGSGADRAAMMERLTSWFLHSAYNAAVAIRTNNLPEIADTGVEPQQFDTYDSALSWLDAEYANLRALHNAALAEGLYETVWLLPIVLDHYSTLRFLHADSMAAHRAATDAARARQDEAMVARQLLCISSRFSNLNLMDETRETATEALDLCRRIGDHTGEAWALIDLGLVHDASGQHNEAIALWEQARTISERLGDRRRAMICRSNIGMARYKNGEPEESAAMFREALADAQELGQLRAQALILGNIAEVELELHRPVEAFAVYTEHQRLATAVGDRTEIAVSFLGLGNALRDMGRFVEAVAQWKEALAIGQELGSPIAEKAKDLIDTVEQTLRPEPEPG